MAEKTEESIAWIHAAAMDLKPDGDLTELKVELKQLLFQTQAALDGIDERLEKRRKRGRNR